MHNPHSKYQYPVWRPSAWSGWLWLQQVSTYWYPRLTRQDLHRCHNRAPLRPALHHHCLIDLIGSLSWYLSSWWRANAIFWLHPNQKFSEAHDHHNLNLHHLNLQNRHHCQEYLVSWHYRFSERHMSYSWHSLHAYLRFPPWIRPILSRYSG